MHDFFFFLSKQQFFFFLQNTLFLHRQYKILSVNITKSDLFKNFRHWKEEEYL